MKQFYFAHPMNTYNTPLEKAVIVFIAHHLTRGDVGAIENPNEPHHQVGYNEYATRVKAEDTKHKGMNYFYDVVLPGCEGCVAMPFLDGRVGLGVAGEAKWYAERKMPVWFLQPTRVPTKKDIEEFSVDPLDSNLFRLRSFTEEELTLLIASDPKLVVPHVETRLRTWKVYNEVSLPYEEAHLAPREPYDGFYPKK